jgi:drug/metabolite transporter (DMT)-like permease
MDEGKQSVISITFLFLAALIWGFAFVAQRVGMDYVGPFFFNGVRFLLGTLVLVPALLFTRRSRAARPRPAVPRRWIVLGCGLLGLILFASITLQQVALIYTTAGKAGLITGLYVVFVPLVGLLRGQRVGPMVWAGSAAAVVGLYLMSVTHGVSLAPGDGLCLLSAVGWAFQVQVVGWLAGKADALVIAVSQYAICAALSLIVAAFAEHVTFSGAMHAGWAIAYAGILSVGVAYTLQVIGQQHVAPAPAGIIMSLEAVFAALGGWLVLGESLTARGLAGAGLMLTGMILSQLRRRRRRVPIP